MVAVVKEVVVAGPVVVDGGSGWVYVRECYDG